MLSSSCETTSEPEASTSRRGLLESHARSDPAVNRRAAEECRSSRNFTNPVCSEAKDLQEAQHRSRLEAEAKAPFSRKVPGRVPCRAGEAAGRQLQLNAHQPYLLIRSCTEAVPKDCLFGWPLHWSLGSGASAFGSGNSVGFHAGSIAGC